MDGTRVAVQINRNVMPTMVRITRRTSAWPRRGTPRHLEIRSMKALPRVVFSIRNGPTRDIPSLSRRPFLPST